MLITDKIDYNVAISVEAIYTIFLVVEGLHVQIII